MAAQTDVPAEVWKRLVKLVQIDASCAVAAKELRVNCSTQGGDALIAAVPDCPRLLLRALTNSKFEARQELIALVLMLARSKSTRIELASVEGVVEDLGQVLSESAGVEVAEALWHLASLPNTRTALTSSPKTLTVLCKILRSELDVSPSSAAVSSAAATLARVAREPEGLLHLAASAEAVTGLMSALTADRLTPQGSEYALLALARLVEEETPRQRFAEHPEWLDVLSGGFHSGNSRARESTALIIAHLAADPMTVLLAAGNIELCRGVALGVTGGSDKRVSSKGSDHCLRALASLLPSSPPHVRITLTSMEPTLLPNLMILAAQSEARRRRRLVVCVFHALAAVPALRPDLTSHRPTFLAIRDTPVDVKEGALAGKICHWLNVEEDRSVASDRTPPFLTHSEMDVDYSDLDSDLSGDDVVQMRSQAVAGLPGLSALAGRALNEV